MIPPLSIHFKMVNKLAYTSLNITKEPFKIILTNDKLSQTLQEYFEREKENFLCWK